jgi:hypothetical protein
MTTMYDHIFSDAVNANTLSNLTIKKNDSKDHTTSRDISTFNFKLAMHTKKRQENKTHTTPMLNTLSSNQLDEYLNDQKEKHLTRSSWKTLDMTFKWSYILDYINNSEIIANLCFDSKKKFISHIKSLLQTNKLNSVQYDNKTRRIVNLGVIFNGKNNGEKEQIEFSV